MNPDPPRNESLLKPKSLRARTVLAVGGVMLIFWAASLSAIFYFLLGSFSRLQGYLTNERIRQTVAQIDDHGSEMLRLVGDNAVWEDAYNFLQGTNPGYVTENYGPGVDTTGQDVVMVFGMDGKLVAAARPDDEKDSSSPPDGLDPQALAKSSLFQGEKGIGMIGVRDGVLLLASHQVLHSSGSGPPLGWLVFGKYLDKSALARIGRLAGGTVCREVRSVSGSLDVTSGAHGTLATSTLGEVMTVRAIGAGQDILCPAQLVFRSLEEGHQIVFMLEVKERVFRTAFMIWQKLIWCAVAGGVALVLIALGAFEILVLRPLTRLQNEITAITDSHSGSLRVPARGAIEFQRVAQSVNQLLDSERLAIQTVNEQKTLLASILDAALEAVIAYQPINDGEEIVDLRIIVFNRSAEKVLNRTAAEVIGTSTSDAFPGVRMTGLLNRMIRVIQSHAAEQFEYQSSTHFDRRWFQISAAPWGAGVLMTFQDITERKLKEEQLRETMDDVERFNRAMIGREERIVELKEEVNALHSRLGSPFRMKGAVMKPKERREDYHACLLGAVADALSLLLGPEDFENAMLEALHLLGEASDADRVYVFENHLSPDGKELLMSQRYEWVRDGVSVQIQNQSLQNLSYAPFPYLYETLRSGRPYHGLVKTFSSVEREILLPQEILSLAKMPISFEGELWGFIGFDECHEERVWTEDELQTLRAAAVGIGGAIGRRKIEQSLKAQADELRRHRRVALSLTEDARRSEQEARASSQAKTIFLAMMSHEIRTPLNGVLGFTDLLLSENLTDRQSELARTIQTCGDALFTLINDILDISRIEAGKLELNATSGSVETCAREVLASFEPQVREKQLTLSLSVAESMPHIVVDMGRFRQVLFNLVGNAVKFTAEGRVDVSFWTEPMESGRVRIFGRVSDTGPGMSPEEQLLIFQPFRQANTTVHRKFGGTGLGLAICQRLTQAMGGDISVSSEAGHGTAFTFSVTADPAQPVFPALEEKKSAAEGLPDLVGVRILIVDDVPANLSLTASFLRRLGYRTDTAADGSEAVKLREANLYEIIFMDVLMPTLDGCEATQKIRRHEQLSQGRSHIIALTADAMNENKIRCQRAGMDDFITKPLRMDDIRMALKRWNDGLSAISRPRDGGEIRIA